MTVIDRQPLIDYRTAVEYKAAPSNEFWHAENPDLQPANPVERVQEILVVETSNLPPLRYLKRYSAGEIPYNETMPSHRPVNGAPREITMDYFLQTAEDERDAYLSGWNLTPLVSLHGPLCFMAVPSRDLCSEHTPQFISDLPEECSAALLTHIGHGLRTYREEHSNIWFASVGITYGHWKSLGENGVVHPIVTMYDNQSREHARSVPVPNLDQDLNGLYSNNVSGILTGNILYNSIDLPTFFGLDVVSKKLASSGTVTFIIDTPIDYVLGKPGNSLVRYLETEMVMRRKEAVGIQCAYDTEAYSYYNYLVNKTFCGAITFSSDFVSDRTSLQIVTGMRMDMERAARGGIFAAEGLWPTRDGIDDFNTALARHENINEFVDHIARMR